MSPIINEWQLGVRLNNALQHQQRADFSLWLALLSPETAEMAEFCTPDGSSEPVQHDIYQQLAIRPQRAFGFSEGDLERMLQQNQALQQGGIPGIKLASALLPEPLVLKDDPRKIPENIWQNLSVHSRRRLTEGNIGRDEANPAGLYQVLQQLHQTDAA